jgi:hypothetical protein
VGTGFPPSRSPLRRAKEGRKRSCSNKKPGQDDDSKKNHPARAFSGKVESGFPFENATNAGKLEHIQFPWKLNVLQRLAVECPRPTNYHGANARELESRRV